LSSCLIVDPTHRTRELWLLHGHCRTIGAFCRELENKSLILITPSAEGD
jgi:hypothetical protein